MWKVIFWQTGCSSNLTSRLGWVASSSREQTAWPAWDFCSVVNSWRDASASSMLGMCATFGGLQAANHPRDPIASPYFLHNLEHFFTLSHTLPLHDSHLNTGLLIAKIQANLTWNKANKMVEDNWMVSLYFLSCSTPTGMMLQLLPCLARVQLLVACKLRATREIQSRVPISWTILSISSHSLTCYLHMIPT